MTKIIVETMGQFGLMNVDCSVIHADRPTCTIDSYLIREKFAEGSVRILARGLPEAATDAEFQAVLQDCKGDIELAVEAFSSLFTLVE